MCVCVPVYTYNVPVRALGSQKYAEFRESSHRRYNNRNISERGAVSLRYDENDDAGISPRGEKLGTGRNCWMRPGKWVPSPGGGCNNGEIYKSKSQPPSFLLSFHPRISTTPLSSFFVYSRENSYRRRCSPGSRCAWSFILAREFLSRYSKPLVSLSRSLPLYTVLVLYLCLPLLIRLTQGLLYFLGPLWILSAYKSFQQDNGRVKQEIK